VACESKKDASHQHVPTSRRLTSDHTGRHKNCVEQVASPLGSCLHEAESAGVWSGAAVGSLSICLITARMHGGCAARVVWRIYPRTTIAKDCSSRRRSGDQTCMSMIRQARSVCCTSTVLYCYLSRRPITPKVAHVPMSDTNPDSISWQPLD
jgi:hypothetical protein